MTWVEYVEDVEHAIRDRVTVDYVTLAVTGTDGHMGSPVEKRHIEGLGHFACKVRNIEGAIIPTLVVGRDNNGDTAWRADLIDATWRDGHGCGDYWLCVYSITEG